MENYTTILDYSITSIHAKEHYWLCFDPNNVHDIRRQLFIQLKFKTDIEQMYNSKAVKQTSF